ncbi:MAG: hypothetical protein ACJ8D6_01470 [Sphingomicrobium sp.]
MDADLTATPTIVNGQVTEWKLCDGKTTCGTGKTSSPYPKIELKKGSTDHSITIQIDEGNGITFAQTNPLWIQQDTKPTAPVVAPTSQIDPSKISGGGTTTLKFKDANTEAMTLKYALQFEGGNGIMSIDPDIQNGGKGIAFYQTAALLVAGGVVVALVLLIVWRRSARRQTMQ